MSQSPSQLQSALEKLKTFVTALDQIAEEFPELVIGAESTESGQSARAFIGYPLWVRVVHCRTTPTEQLLKIIQNFSVQPAPGAVVRILQLQRDLLTDAAFVSAVQSLPDRVARRNWLEQPACVSPKGRTLVSYCGRLSLPYDER